ncbi:MAG: choice-of-anchor V domain-containing protein [bacterium]
MRRWLAGALFVMWAATAQAYSTGIATTSFPVPAQACNFCHGGGIAPTVALVCVDCGGGPPVVAPLSVHEFKLTVFEIGLQDHAGLNVSSAIGTLSTGGVFATNTQTLVGTGGRSEVTHTAPKQEVGGVTEFSFLWTAPGSAATATLQGWGNAVNFNGSTGGDAAASAALNVSVGGDTPTPTDTPMATNTPTSTPTPTAACPATVDLGCTDGFASGSLQIKANVPGHEKFLAKLSKGPALAQTAMGNPLDVGQGGSGTAYALCVYDGTSNLAGFLVVDRASDSCDGKPCWKPLGRAPNDPHGPGKGYRYKDGTLAADGVRKLLYKGGDAGKSKAIIIGKGPGLPNGLAPALQFSAQATVQLRSSDGVCLTQTLTDIRRQEPDYFQAK